MVKYPTEKVQAIMQVMDWSKVQWSKNADLSRGQITTILSNQSSFVRPTTVEKIKIALYDANREDLARRIEAIGKGVAEDHSLEEKRSLTMPMKEYEWEIEGGIEFSYCGSFYRRFERGGEKVFQEKVYNQAGLSFWHTVTESNMLSPDGGKKI